LSALSNGFEGAPGYNERIARKVGFAKNRRPKGSQSTGQPPLALGCSV
jgi:hypothetical protein